MSIVFALALKQQHSFLTECLNGLAQQFQAVRSTQPTYLRRSLLLAKSWLPSYTSSNLLGCFNIDIHVQPSPFTPPEICRVVATSTSTSNHHNSLCFPQTWTLLNQRLEEAVFQHRLLRQSQRQRQKSSLKTKTTTKIKMKNKDKGKKEVCFTTIYSSLPSPCHQQCKNTIFPPAGLSDQFGKQRIIQLARANGLKNISFWAHDRSSGI